MKTEARELALRADLAKRQLEEAALPALLTTKQAAALAGCGTRTWWRWTRSGVAPAPLKIGGGVRPAVRFNRDELLAWIAAGCPRV